MTAVPKAYDLALWLVPRVNEFPRSQRFVLGDRIETAALDLLDTLVEAQFSRDKLQPLAQANALLTRLRHLLRLANDLHLLGARRYEFVSERIDELGRMVGGWSRQQQRRRAGTALEAAEQQQPEQPQQQHRVSLREDVPSPGPGPSRRIGASAETSTVRSRACRPEARSAGRLVVGREPKPGDPRDHLDSACRRLGHARVGSR